MELITSKVNEAVAAESKSPDAEEKWTFDNDNDNDGW